MIKVNGKLYLNMGKDIICMGDFAVSNHRGNSAFSFRIPSIQMTDYVIELNKEKLIGTHGKGKRKSNRK